MNPTTEELEQAALKVRCPVHEQYEGVPCTLSDVACMDRRSIAAAGRWLAEYPAGGQLTEMSWDAAVAWLERSRNNLQALVEVFGRLPVWDDAEDGEVPGGEHGSRPRLRTDDSRRA